MTTQLRIKWHAWRRRGYDNVHAQFICMGNDSRFCHANKPNLAVVMIPSTKDLEVPFINSGWKDTVLVMPGEEIEILKPFEHYTGLFLYHCHNLEHEYMGMMRNVYVS